MEPLALIVEDDNSTTVLLQQIVRSAGLAAVCTDDGASALDILEETTPLVIILDILLPRVNGIDVLNYVERTPRLDNTFVIIVSSHDASNHSWETARANMYCIKPIRVKELRETLQNTVRQLN
jgi:chemosensory pili system protein ChpA (sensor histidine kinase/response regulator)